MANKFHLKPNGAISRCGAQAGGCPYGGESGTENHFSSLQEAREAFEAANASRTVSSLRKKEATPPAGGGKLPPRPPAGGGAPQPPEEDPSSGKPAPKTPWQEARERQEREAQGAIALTRSSTLTDERAAGLVKQFSSSPQVLEAVITSPSRNVSRETRLQALRHMPASSMTRETFTAFGARTSRLLPAMDTNQRYRAALLSPSRTTQAALAAEVEKAPTSYEGNLLAVGLYENPSTSKKLKDTLAQQNPTVESLSRLDAIQKDSRGTFFEGLPQGVQRGGGRGRNAYDTITFDAAQVQELGLEGRDLHAFVTHRMGARGTYTGYAYDEVKGVYRGYLT